MGITPAKGQTVGWVGHPAIGEKVTVGDVCVSQSEKLSVWNYTRYGTGLPKQISCPLTCGTA